MSRRLILIAMAALVAIAVTPVFAGGSKEGAATGSAGGATLPYTGAMVEYKGFGADLGIKEDPNSEVAKAYRKGIGNVTIKWDTVPFNDYDTKLNLYVQSGDLPDIMWSRNGLSWPAEYGPKGIFLDWDKYKQYMPNVQKWAGKFPHINNVLLPTGERYSINDIATAEYMGEGWFYNKALLAKAGVTAPPDDFNQMFDAMMKVKNTSPTAFGYDSYWGIGYIQGAFGNAMNAQSGIYYDPAQKKWIFGWFDNPNVKKLYVALNKAYANKLFNPEIMSVGGITNEKDIEIFEGGNYAFSYHYYGESYGRWASKGRPDPMVGMRPPKADDGKRYYWITVKMIGNLNGWAFMASSKVKNPALLASYIDNVMSEKTYELFEWGIEGKSFKKNADGTLEFLPEYLTDTPGGATVADKQKALGIYALMDPRYIHFSDYAVTWFGKLTGNPTAKGDPGRQANADDIKMLKNGQAVPLWGWPTPQMTADQTTENGKIMTPVNTFINENALKFITGDKKMDEWDDFIAQAKKIGDVAKVLANYNSGKQFKVPDPVYPIIPKDLQ